VFYTNLSQVYLIVISIFLEIDNAVFISISTAPEETPPENPDTTDQNQS
jgi:hypothetical protein